MATGPRVRPVMRSSGMACPCSRHSSTGGKKAYCASATTQGSSDTRRNRAGARSLSFQNGRIQSGGIVPITAMISAGGGGGGGAMARWIIASSVSE